MFSLFKDIINESSDKQIIDFLNYKGHAFKVGEAGSYKQLLRSSIESNLFTMKDFKSFIKQSQPKGTPFLCRLGLHKWSKWTTEKKESYFNMIFKMQRNCIHCNRPQFKVKKYSKD